MSKCAEDNSKRTSKDQEERAESCTDNSVADSARLVPTLLPQTSYDYCDLADTLSNSDTTFF